jgi:hypothetical protein
MIRLKFSEFMSGEYDKRGERHVIYILIAESCILYIGMSSGNLWHRWFAYPGSHIRQYTSTQWGYNSPAGEAVVRCAPESMNWTVELWTAEDCIKLLSDDESLGRLDPRDLRELEWLMIDRLHPAFNAAGRNYSTSFEDLPKSIQSYKLADEEKALAAHKRVFGNR